MSKQTNELRKLLRISKQEYDIRAEITASSKPDSYYKSKLELLNEERNAIRTQLEDKLLCLSSVEFKIFDLRYLKGRSARSIAKRLNYSISTIQHKLATISNKLK